MYRIHVERVERGSRSDWQERRQLTSGFYKRFSLVLQYRMSITNSRARFLKHPSAYRDSHAQDKSRQKRGRFVVRMSRKGRYYSQPGRRFIMRLVLLVFSIRHGGCSRLTHRPLQPSMVSILDGPRHQILLTKYIMLSVQRSLVLICHI